MWFFFLEFYSKLNERTQIPKLRKILHGKTIFKKISGPKTTISFVLYFWPFINSGKSDYSFSKTNVE